MFFGNLVKEGAGLVDAVGVESYLPILVFSVLIFLNMVFVPDWPPSNLTEEMFSAGTVTVSINGMN